MHADGYETVIPYTMLILLCWNNYAFRKLCSTLFCQVSLGIFVKKKVSLGISLFSSWAFCLVCTLLYYCTPRP
jgi:hypothetical protein